MNRPPSRAGTGPDERGPGPPPPGRARRVLSEDFFARDARVVARELLGKLLVAGDGRVARLVEVEAYLGTDDPGSHAARGPTPRAAAMFGAPGRLYVYFSYGMHWCANLVCGPEGVAAAVLLRAAQPLEGLEQMAAERARGGRAPAVRDLCRGPGRLAAAFGLSGQDNGLPAVAVPGCGQRLELVDDGAGPGGQVVVTTRTGLSPARGAELPYRFVVAASLWASGKATG